MKGIKYNNRKIGIHGKQFRVTIGGQKKDFPTVDAAKRFIDTALAQQSLTKAALIGKNRTTIEEALETALVDREASGLAALSVRNTKLALNSYRAFDSTSKYIDDITYENFQQWMMWHRAKGNAQTTIGQYGMNLRAFLRWCNKNEIITDHKVLSITFAMGEAGEAAKRAFTTEEVEVILKHVKKGGYPAYEYLYPVLLFCSWTGIRPIGITNIKKEHFDEDTGSVSASENIHKSKGVDFLHFRKDEEMVSILRHIKATWPTEYLFVSSRGTRWTTEGLQATMKRLRKTLNLPKDVSFVSGVVDP